MTREMIGNCGYRKDIYYWLVYRLTKIIGNIFDNPEITQEITKGSD